MEQFMATLALRHFLLNNRGINNFYFSLFPRTFGSYQLISQLCFRNVYSEGWQTDWRFISWNAFMFDRIYKFWHVLFINPSLDLIGNIVWERFLWVAEHSNSVRWRFLFTFSLKDGTLVDLTMSLRGEIEYLTVIIDDLFIVGEFISLCIIDSWLKHLLQL